MNNKKLGIALLLIAAAIPSIGLAESSAGSGISAGADSSVSSDFSKKEIRKNARGEIKDVKVQTRNSVKDARTQARENVKKEREDLRDEVKNIRATSTLSGDEKKNKIKEALKEKQGDLEKIREEKNKKIEEIRADSKKSVLEKREALKTGLKKVKDQKKVQIVQKTDGKLEEINNNRTDHLSDVLNQLEKNLAKINARISAAEAKGVDISSAKSASDDAAKAIISARTAVEAQAAKVYKMTITDENKLKVDVGNTVQKLQDDLKQVRIIVQSAHDSVKKTAAALAKATGFEDKKPNNVSSSSISSSEMSSSSVGGAFSSSASSVSSEAVSSQSSS